MTNPWTVMDAKERIQKRLQDVVDVEIGDYRSGLSLENIPVNKAYRMNGVHIYVDILNLGNILGDETDRDLRRALRFLNLHYRAVHRILNDVGAIKVDFAGPRLHAIVTPQASGLVAEEDRVHRAIAVAQLIADVLGEIDGDDEHLPPARVRVGIDTGLVLAVNNGRRGNREPLFLGEPANNAAKLAAFGRGEGIYLSKKARAVIGLSPEEIPGDKALTGPQVKASQDRAQIGVSKDYIAQQWRADLHAEPLKAFQFRAHTLPFSTLNIAKDVSPAQTVKQDAVSIYADIDGFTSYVARHIRLNAKDVVRSLHVIRAELDAVLHTNFGGRKIRFIGDCIHGVLAMGTAYKTDASASVSQAALAAGAMRSSFGLCLDALRDIGVNTDGLGLGIGFDYGALTVTRLGVRGSMIRCATSKAVLSSEAEQQKCGGAETAIGEVAYRVASKPVKDLFSSGNRKASRLDYAKACASLANGGDLVALGNEDRFRAVVSPTVMAVGGASLRAYATQGWEY